MLFKVFDNLIISYTSKATLAKTSFVAKVTFTEKTRALWFFNFFKVLFELE